MLTIYIICKISLS